MSTQHYVLPHRAQTMVAVSLAGSGVLLLCLSLCSKVGCLLIVQAAPLHEVLLKAELLLCLHPAQE